MSFYVFYINDMATLVNGKKVYISNRGNVNADANR